MKLMRFFRTLTAVLLVAAGQVVHAQQPVTVKFQTTVPNPAVMQYSYFVGPFWGTLLSDPTRPTINLFCVDILNPVSWGLEWRANTTSLAGTDLSNTRHGTAALDKYRKAAWLSSQFALNGHSDWDGIQAAMWNVLNPGSPDGGAEELYWLGQANAFSASAAWNSHNWDQYTVLTPEYFGGRIHGGPQEFITTSFYVPQVVSPVVTPEPSTWLLMATGLAGIIGFAVLRGARV